MFISFILIIVGLIGNLTSLITFIFINSNFLKLASSNFLISLTLANIIYLCLFCYTSTLNRTIFYLNLNGQTNILNSINLIDKNYQVCKILGLIKNICLTLNVSILILFSLERLLAVYFPVKMLHYRRNNSKLSNVILGIVILKAIITNFYIYYYSNLVQIDEFKNNSTSNFNSFSINLTIEKTYCSIPHNVFNSFLKFHASKYIYMIVAYFIVSFSLITIIIKFKKTNKTISRYSSIYLSKTSKLLNKSHDQLSSNDLSKLNSQNQKVKEN